MATVDFSNEEINILLKSARNCLSNCHEGGLNAGCPDCQRLERVMLKMQGAVGQGER